MTLRLALLAILLSVLTAFVTAKVMKHEPAPDAGRKETSFERVMRTNTIRCGYFPIREFLTRDEKTGKLQGPSYDIVEAMGKALDLKIEWTGETAPATMANDLQSGRYDMICSPLTATATRGRVMFSSRVVFFMPIYLWVHKDSPLASREPEAFNDPGISVAIIDGTSFVHMKKRLFPDAKTYSLPDLSPPTDMLLAVSGKKADTAFFPAMTGDHFAREHGGIIRKAGTKPATVHHYQFPLPQGDENFRNMINTALDEMLYNGTINAILAKHDATPPRYFWPLREVFQQPK